MRAKSAIGLVGLATMGANLARNIANKGFKISVFNRTIEKTEKFIKDFAVQYPSKSVPIKNKNSLPETISGAKNLPPLRLPYAYPASYTSASGAEQASLRVQTSDSSLLHGSLTLKDFVSSLETPRKIILLVKAGSPVDDIIAELTPLLDKNDIIIDCGNSHYKDTERRQKDLTTRNLNFIGCGISGGEEGALHGPSLMPGGNQEAWKKIAKIFTAVAAKIPGSNQPVPAYRTDVPSDATVGAGENKKTLPVDTSACVTYIGPGGSGHFVKMVHNGIEYAIMQLLAETYDILKNLGKFSNPELAKIFTGYNKNPNLKSFLIEITAKIFTKKDPESTKKDAYLIDLIKDSAGQKGTGKWTTEIAHELGVFIPTINAAVDARIVSGDTKSRAMSQDMLKINTTAKNLTSTDQKNLIKLVENALELATMICYEQGVNLISKAGKEFNWNLNLSEITRIWQGGCIIRSGYLKNLTIALSNKTPEDKKTATAAFTKIMKTLNGEKQKSWRKLLSLALESGIPIAAFYSTLNYYDSYAAPHLPQNLIQAQRDFFGAHGYERTDKPGSFHTKWN